MPLPEFTRKLIEVKLFKYCLNRIPEEARHNVKLNFKINENEVTLILTRPYFRNPSKWAERSVAQIRFDNNIKRWQLFFIDKKNSWRPYDLIQPSADFDDLLKELDRDPTGVFWG